MMMWWRGGGWGEVGWGEPAWIRGLNDIGRGGARSDGTESGGMWWVGLGSGRFATPAAQTCQPMGYAGTSIHGFRTWVQDF